MSRSTAFLALALFVASPLAADTHPNLERGFAADKAFQVGDVDHVNGFNGNLVITLPIASFPAGGSLSYGVSVVFNSNPWNFQERQQGDQIFQQAVVNSRANAGFGWVLSLGRLESPTTAPNTSGKWLYIGPDGSEHAFFTTLHEGEMPTTGVWYTRDGSYMRLKDIGGGLYEVEMPNGEIHQFAAGSELIQKRDRFGNWVSLNPGASAWTISDSQGRTQTVNFIGAGTNKRVSTVVVSAFNNTTATYTFGYTSANLAYPCPHDDPQLPGPESVYLLTSITRPDGSSFSLPAYHLDQSAGCRTPGSPKSLVLPTLGKVAYTYQEYVFPAEEGGRIARTRSNGVATRTLYEANGNQVGQWQYTTALHGAVELENTVTTPLSHKTEQFFSVSHDPLGTTWNLHEYGLPLSHNFTSGTGAGARFLSTREYGKDDALLRSTYVRYERDEGVFSDTTEAAKLNQRLASTRTVYQDDGGRFADADSTGFDGLGHYRTTSTDGNFDAGNARTSSTSYNSSRGSYPGGFSMLLPNDKWLLETFDQQDETEAGKAARRTFYFDPQNGWLLRVRTHLQDDGQAANKDLILERVPDDVAKGSLKSERYYGGDTQTVSTGDLSTLSLPGTPKYRIDHTTQHGVRATSTYVDAGGNDLSFKSLNQTIDLNTGLPSSSRDTAGVETTFDYDELGRTTRIKPGAGESWTQLVYTRATSAAAPAQVNVYRRANGVTSGATLAESLVKFDAFGRVAQERQKMRDDSFSIRETSYNAMGWKKSVSQLGNVNKPTQYVEYDPFGRPGQVVSPDGSFVAFTYNGVSKMSRSVAVGDEVGDSHRAFTTETYDRQGRLSEVKEEAEADSSNTITTYFYDVGNRLIRPLRCPPQPGPRKEGSQRITSWRIERDGEAAFAGAYLK